MTQRNIETAVAAGESRPAAVRRGLAVIGSEDDWYDPEPEDEPPQYLAWEQMQEVCPVDLGRCPSETEPCMAPF